MCTCVCIPLPLSSRSKNDERKRERDKKKKRRKDHFFSSFLCKHKHKKGQSFGICFFFFLSFFLFCKTQTQKGRRKLRSFKNRYGCMDLESEGEEEDEAGQEREREQRLQQQRRRVFVAVCFEIEEESGNTNNKDDDDENASELEERLLDVTIQWKRRRLVVHEWRTVRDRSGARLEEEEEDKLVGVGGGKEGKLYFDILLSFLGTSGDESLLLRKMWTRVVRHEKRLDVFLKDDFGGDDGRKRRSRNAMMITAKDADVLMSAPCRFPFLKDESESCDGKYSYDKRHEREKKDDLRENFRANGYLIADGGTAAKGTSSCRVSKTLVDSFRMKTHERIEVILSALRENHSHVSVGTDAFAYKEIGSRGKYRFDALFDKEKEEEDALFKFAKSDAPWVEPVKDILRNAEDIDINISIVWTEPNCSDQEWHCDGAHRGDQETYDEQTGALVKTHGPPYAVCVFMTLLDLDDTVGYTEFWPTSHKNAGLLGFGAAAHALGGVQSNKNAKAGDWVVYDYRLMHRGIGNESKDTRRPILQFMYAVDGYKERKNYGQKSVFSPC